MDNLTMEIITTTSNELFFRSLLLVTLLAMQTVRYKYSSPRAKALLFMSVFPLLILVIDYHSFAVAVGERSTLSFYTGFLNHYFYFYFVWVPTLMISMIAMFDKKL